MKAADAYRRKRLSPKSDGDTTDLTGWLAAVIYSSLSRTY